MQRLVICSGILGGGSAIVFALAAATAILVPATHYLPVNQNAVMFRAMDVTAPGFVGQVNIGGAPGMGGTVTMDSAWPSEPAPVEAP